MRALTLVLVIGLVTGVPSLAETETERLLRQIRELKQQIEEMESRHAREIDELKELYERLIEQLDVEEDETEDELEALREEAQAVAAADAEADNEDEPQEPVAGRQRSLQSLNPEISFLGDVSYDWTDTEVQDQFLLRSAEISFQSALDPYTRFKGYLAAHQEPFELGAEEEEEEEGHDEITVNLEEAYMEWVALPLNSRLRVGKFRQQFGTLNRWHPHALPSTDVPFALRNIFGEEGLVGLGVGYDLPLPKLWADTNGLTLEVVNPDNESAFAGGKFSDPAVLLRHTGFFDIGEDAYLELNLNATIGPNDEEGNHDTSVGGLELNFIWEPVQEAKYRGVEFRSEYIGTRFETDGPSIRSQSLYAYLTWKLARRWSMGLRYDDAELPWDRFELLDGLEFREGLRERAWTPFVTFWQSEFVRLRAQYQHAKRDFGFQFGPDDDDRIWIQATFAAGPHKHEAY